jgi:hypothetical protein
MPQPIRPPSTSGVAGPGITTGPNILEQRPDILLRVATIVTNWSLIEDELTTIYGLVMGDYITLPKNILDSGLAWSPPNHPIAFQIFEKIQSLYAKLDLIDGILEWRAKQHQLAAFRDIHRKSIQKSYAKRNQIAHGIWGVCEDYPLDAVLLPKFGRQMRYSLRDFNETNETIISTHRDFGKFIHELYLDRAKKLNSLKTEGKGDATL